MNWIKGKRKHFVIWGVVLIYLLSANPLYTRFILKDGKPLDTRVTLPAPSTGMVYKLATFQPVQYNGQDLYQLRGYAFIKSAPEQQNTIRIVLKSPTQQYVFPTSTVDHPNMIESYPGYKPGMASAEFIMLIAQGVLEPGTYTVGILVNPKNGAQPSYVNSGSFIKTTYNTITYLPAP